MKKNGFMSLNMHYLVVGGGSQSSRTSEENPGLSISCGCFFGGMGGGVPGVSMALASLSQRSDEKPATGERK